MTLKELAEMLSLSPTTVSRALNGYPEVNAETRARIEAAAREHGYQPNTMARKLATGKAMAVGHVIPLGEHQMINPIFAEFMTGASEVYSKVGYETILTVVPEKGEEDAYRDLARRHSVDGVIVHAPRTGDPRIKLLTELGLPFVLHGRPVGDDGPSVCLDIKNARAFRQATQFLIDLGHRRIALLNGLEQISFALRRRAGYEQAMERGGIATDPSLSAHQEMTETNGYNTTMAWMQRAERPTAILTSSIISAIGVSRAVRDAGLELGHDVSLITHDDDLSFLRNEGDPPRFTTTFSSISAAGHRCAEMVLDLIAGKPVESEVWDCQLVEGRSTGPAPA
ncbi:LacI family DNA-binding transcriptional regulator [Pontivivens ytuae]|nr:substrate-binding domain-containing protein [Pontivivens ytuae]